MNTKHRKTFEAIFAKPTPKNLNWSAVEGLLIACGCNVIEGNGSRVRFEKDSVIAFFHRPHPSKEAKPYQVRDAKEYLEKIGVRP